MFEINTWLTGNILLNNSKASLAVLVVTASSVASWYLTAKLTDLFLHFLLPVLYHPAIELLLNQLCITFPTPK